MTMRTNLKKHLQDYWVWDLMAIFGISLMIFGAAAPDALLYISGGFVVLCGLAMIQSQRICDLNKKIKNLEKSTQKTSIKEDDDGDEDDE